MIKKILILMLILCLALFVASCGENDNNSNNENTGNESGENESGENEGAGNEGGNNEGDNNEDAGNEGAGNEGGNNEGNNNEGAGNEGDNNEGENNEENESQEPQEPTQVTVTLDTKGGENLNSITVDLGEAIETLPTPTRENYNFVAWCTDESLQNEVVLPFTPTENTTLYAKWNEKIDMVALLEELLNGYMVSPYSYIPESMIPGFDGTVVDKDSIITNYTQNTNVSSIIHGGYGEQWQMVIENLNQSEKFYNVLSVIEGLTTTSVSAFNDYLDENPGDTAEHSFLSGIYTATITFDGERIKYILDYTADIAFFGEQTIQIAMDMDADNKDKSVRIQIGDANVLKYVISERSYEFAIKYLGVRRALFTVSTDENDITSGHIYEFLTYEGTGIKSAADFYITDEYASVVGNKASGMIGFTGYISELYGVETGKLLGYEVNETLSLLSFNTLWFNLNDIEGINSIRYVEAGENSAFYINGSSTAWEAKEISLINRSRRFDIEFRTQYFYYYDVETEKYEVIEASVPMLFVQEEQLDNLESDVSATNDVNITVSVDENDLAKIMLDYDLLIPVFIENKELVSEQLIIDYIGEKTDV